MSRAKYGNVKTEVGGIVFDSKREAGHWSELVLLEKAGKIRNLQRQVRYSLDVNGKKIGTYVADFVYEERVQQEDFLSLGWRTVVADSKGVKTPLYSRSKKHMEAQYKIAIKEL